MATQDVSIWDETQTKVVSIITDGSKERLAVDAKSQLWDTTNTVGVIAGTPNRLAVDANISGGTLSGSVDNEVTIATNQGKAFMANSGTFITLGANSTLTILMITPASPSVNLKDMTVNISKSGNTEPTLCRLWESSTVSANGASVTAFNTKRPSVIANQMTIFTGPTITATGTKLLEYVAHTDWETYIAPSYTSPFKLILKPSTNYLLQFNNTSNQAVTLTWLLFWMEL